LDGKAKGLRIEIEQFVPTYSLFLVSKLTQVVALTVLAFWSLAAMHCKLEAVPGFDFLKTCCFVDSVPASPIDCETDGCGAVEDGNYRSEEQTASAPQPLLILALLSSLVGAPMPELQAHSFVVPQVPPEFSKVWQFSHRTALPPRAPSIAS
jgi:hypothetical protein